MELFVIQAINDDHFVIEDEKGTTETVKRSCADWPVQADMPVLRAKDASIRPYEGAFFDEEDGVYKRVALEDGHLILKARSAPKSQEEIKAFLIELVKAEDPSICGCLDEIIEDMLSRGETELAFMLMNRQEAAAPSKSMAAMQARYSRNLRETKDETAKKRRDRTLNRA